MAFGTLQVSHQRPQSRDQRAGQRLTFRDNPFTGIPWGTAGWPDNIANALDLTAESLTGAYPGTFADLATLKADGTYGDGVLAYNAGANFTSGQYVVLGDGSKAYYNTAAWSAGVAP